MKNLELFVRNTWDGDVTYDEAVENFTDKQINLMEFAFIERPKLVKGLPEDFQPETRSERLLQELVDNFEGC